ncbi:MAG: RloB family protein [Anaerolineae bacterium]|nr:RloB family protein [Anaerolineae bacterium]
MRKFKPRERKSGLRDAKLIIIAAEGAKTEKRYFSDLAVNEQYRNPKVHVEILDRLQAEHSAPEYVIQMLDEFRQTYSLGEQDELWLVIDLDRWGSGKLSDISTQCIQKSYLLAVSNPGFEIWLLLHVASLEEYTLEQLEQLSQPGKPNDARTPLEIELMKRAGSYNKSNLNTADYLPSVDLAINRARAIDVNPEHRWTNHIGTRVYLLVESIIRSSRPTNAR